MPEKTEITALKLGDQIEKGALDPVELAETTLEKIGKTDPEGQIFVHLAFERTRREALAARERARTGRRLGPLDGVPVAWKDNVETAGLPTRAGSRLLGDHVPQRDAPILARATRAGTVFLGKTNLTEIAFSGLGINPQTGTPANPHDTDTPRAPGGSSSGTAVALARGLCSLGIGTDTGGSVRIPAAWNGIVGLKTTTGALPTDGVVPLVASLDTIGPLARTVGDAAALWAVLAAEPCPDLSGADIGRARLLALPSEALDWNEPAVLEAYETALAALEHAGVTLERRAVPAYFDARALAGRHKVPGVPEASALWGETMARQPGTAWSFIEARIDEARPGDAIGWAGYLHDLKTLSRRIVREMAGHAGFVMPTAALRPPPIAALETDGDAYARANRRSLSNTAPINALGLCAMSLPAGWTRPDAEAPALPFGLQIVAAPFEERRLLRLAATLEPVLDALDR